MISNLANKTYGSVIDYKGFQIQPEDVSSVVEFMGYTSYFYADRTFASALEERDAIQAEMFTVNAQLKEATRQKGFALLANPTKYQEYKALEASLQKRYDTLKAAYNLVFSVYQITKSGGEAGTDQAVIQAREALKRTTSAGATQAKVAADNRKKLLSFLIPAVAGVAAGFIF